TVDQQLDGGGQHGLRGGSVHGICLRHCLGMKWGTQLAVIARSEDIVGVQKCLCNSNFCTLSLQKCTGRMPPWIGIICVFLRQSYTAALWRAQHALWAWSTPRSHGAFRRWKKCWARLCLCAMQP